MPISAGHGKPQNNPMKAHRNQRQYIYRHCQLCRVTPSCAVFVGVCILMLPMLELATEHIQLTTVYRRMNHAHPSHMIFSYTNLLPFLSNVLPAMVLQNRVEWSNIKCLSFHSRVRHVSFSPGPTVPTGVRRRVVRVVLLLLLLMSGDIETNPGPVGQQLSENDLCVLMEELNNISVKWNNIGLQLGVSVGALNAIKKDCNSTSDCLRETLTTWLKTRPSPKWSNMVDALRSKTVGEMNLAADLEQKYHLTQDTTIVATHHHALPAPPVSPSQAHTQTTLSPQPTMPPTQPPSFTFPYSVTPPSHPPSWFVPYYYSPHTSYPFPAPFPLTPLTSGAATASVHPSYSQPHQVTPTSSRLHLPSVPAQVTTPQFLTAPTQCPSPSSFNITPRDTSPISSLATVTTPPDLPQRVTTHTLDPTRPHTIKDRVQYFENKFSNLVDKTCQEVNKKIEPPIFLSRVTCLPVAARPQHRSFIEERLMNIPPPETFAKIWSILNLYWDFLNYGLLEHVINKCGSEELKQQMQDYVDELSAFKQATRLCDFINSWPCRDDGPPEDRLKKVVVKMKHEWSQCTLHDVESFMKSLVHKFFLPEFDIILQKAEEGCVRVTWLTSPSIGTLLQQNLANIETQFFKKHAINVVTIDGQDIYLSPVNKYSDYLRDLYNSEQHPVGIGPLTIAEKLLPFKLARIEKEKVSIDEFTRRYLRGDMDDVGSLGTEFYKKSPTKFEEVGKHTSHHRQKLVLIEGAPGVGKTTFSWEYCRKWGKGEILQDHSLLLLLPLRDNNLKQAKILSDLFYHPIFELQQAVVQEVTKNQGQGVAIWLEAWDELHHEQREKGSVFLDLVYGRMLPLATVFVTSRPWASEYLREKYGHRITQHVEILTSAKDQIAHYISKAEAEAQPSSFAAKFTDYLSSYPVIRAAMYTPVTAKMSAEVFSWSQHTESPPPTTMTELFTAFTLKTLVDHLSTHPVYQTQQLKVTTFSDLSADVYKQFRDLCRMAYEGILNRQQLVFSVTHLPTGFAVLGLMQEVPQLYTEGRASSYHFIHLILQEYLAAVHISKLPAHEQTRIFQEHVNSGHFKMTMRFLAGLTKLANIPADNMMDTKHNYFHFLFEAKDISMTTRTLGSDQMDVTSYHFWTPLDYYVTGHAISHSNCPWKLNCRYSCIDDEKFKLLCQGCAAPGGTGCKGHISYADFRGNDITSESIQSFVNIPPYILHDTRMLYLSHNKLDGNACDLLAKAVPSMSRLEVLWLGGNPIGSGGAVKVIKALCGSGVKQLLLHNTGIRMPDCEALCELLKSSNSLQRLHIDRNNFSSEGVTSILSGLSHNSSLTELDISYSHFSMANVDSLASVLHYHSKCTLTMLYLRDCHISSEGVIELAGVLCKNTALTGLNLCNNSIGEHVEAVTVVAKMLAENKTLKELYLQDCHISSKGAVELATALSKNLTIKHVYLEDNPIGVEGASSMSNMLQQNTSLEVLSLCDDSVGKVGVQQLISSLKHNQTLRELCLLYKYKSQSTDRRIRWLR